MSNIQSQSHMHTFYKASPLRQPYQTREYTNTAIISIKQTKYEQNSNIQQTQRFIYKIPMTTTTTIIYIYNTEMFINSQQTHTKTSIQYY